MANGILASLFGPQDTQVLLVAAVLFAVATVAILLVIPAVRRRFNKSTIPVSVNYFFSRKCNKECGFCFHTAKTSYVLSQDEAHRGLRLLKEAGMKKLNIAGGEPFLYPKFLGAMLQFCKENLRLESVSIVTNGSKVTERFLKQYGRYIDVLAVSCDSFNEQTNIEIGRGDGSNVAQLFRIRDWCRKYNIKFKLNTVVCRLNYDEDMVDMVSKLAPFRWKVFQVLMVRGENDSEETLRDVRKWEITDEEFGVFCDRHRGIPSFIPENNRVMASSYLLVDEYMRFMDKGSGKMRESESILDVGVQKALSQVRWDQEAFYERGGVYDWSKEMSDEKPGVKELAESGALDW
ncbi:Radical S-adenosyl methionine domain-containing protein 2 [Madurella mycetomatis]|uniref:Radical S-adenosyl methionine domain-containing protein 2 n=1 Tax=Madurella mycetomatis TaxID=100816 RepID=A0A175W4A8_9PEZI|nr:Radical S-adenosyl methionine domain-containing protein 2 [Madurella mycetomatis]